MSLKTSLMKAGKSLMIFADKNAPELFTAAAGVGVILTAVMTAQATVKAKEIADDIQFDEVEETGKIETLPKIEVVKAVWPCYIPAFLMGSATITSLIFANRVSAKRQAALLASYELAQTALKDYQRKVIERLGENKERAIRHELHGEELRQHPFTDEEQRRVIDPTECWFFDPKTGQRFVSTIEKVKRAFLKVNTELRENAWDWYDLSDVIHDAGGNDSELAFHKGFMPNADSHDVIDLNYLCDPHIEEVNGHEVVVIYLDYDVQDRDFF